jgi:predicted DCC family thiol-disulfide oxidoreductase YuxK
MSKTIIIYDGKCKHCSNLTFRANSKNKKQSYCGFHKEFTTLKTKACKDFKI